MAEVGKMPVITLYRKRLEALIPIKYEEIVDNLPYLGLDIEELTEEYVKVEYTPNRPDLSTDYGIARALKGLLGIEIGRPKHEIKSSAVEFIADESVRDVRPFVAGFVVRGLKLDDETIRQIISMQEDLHEGLGRRRKKLAIGLHDASPIVPPIRYTTVGPEFSFVPLNETREMTVEEILRELPTGQKYGDIVAPYGRFPILIDSKGTVLSLPPIINGNVTRVTEYTRDMLIDLTGTDPRVLADAAAILAEAFIDAGGEVESATIRYPDGTTKAVPDLSPRVMELRPEYARSLLGVEISDEEMMKALSKCRFDCKKMGNVIRVEVPAYRVDLLHEVDLVEEVGYGLGYQNLQPMFEFPYSDGRYLRTTRFHERVRDIAIGLGFTEVVNFMLLSKEVLYEKMSRKVGGLRVESTKSREHEYLRDMLLPGLLQTLSYNVHEPQPHKIFEIGAVFLRDERSETGISERARLALVISHSTANYTDAKSTLEALITPFIQGDVKYITLEAPYIFNQRGAKVAVGPLKVAELGEVHPDVIKAFGLRNPTSFIELDLDALMVLWEKVEKRI